MSEWQRGEILALIGLLLTIVAVAAAIHTVPEDRKRRALGGLFGVVLAIAVLLLVGSQVPRQRNIAESNVATVPEPAQTSRGKGAPENLGKTTPVDETPLAPPQQRPAERSVPELSGSRVETSCEGPVTLLKPNSRLPLASNDPTLSVTRIARVSENVIVSMGNCYRTFTTVVCDLDIVRVNAPATLRFTDEGSYMRVQGQRYERPVFHLVDNLPVLRGGPNLQQSWSPQGVVKLAPCVTGRLKVMFANLPRKTSAIDEIVLIAGDEAGSEAAITFPNLAVGVDV